MRITPCDSRRRGDVMNTDLRMKNNELRTVITQGCVMTILAAKSKHRAGGGKRGAQKGHTRRSELRLHNRLLTFIPADQVIWLTYPQIRGPIGVGKDAKAFIGKLERRLGHKVGAVIKMETQERLSPELGILIWNLDRAYLDTGMVEKIWSETIRTLGKVRVESVRDWNRLAPYISKQVVVTETEIVIGSKRLPFTKPESSDSNFIKRAHNPRIPEQNNTPFSNPYLDSMESAQARREWVSYSGRFHWKHRDKLIPRHDKMIMQVSEKDLAPIRGRINSKRTLHFVGTNDSMTLRGDDALWAVKELGRHAEASHKDVPGPKHSCPLSPRHDSSLSISHNFAGLLQDNGLIQFGGAMQKGRGIGFL